MKNLIKLINFVSLKYAKGESLSKFNCDKSHLHSCPCF